MTEFWLPAGLLLLVALSFLLIPVLRVRRAQQEEDRTALNVALYQERVAELTLDPEVVKRTKSGNEAFDKDPRDTSTPRAMSTLLTQLFTGKALSPASTEVLVQIMERCRTCSARLRGSLPPGTKVADKSGTVTKILVENGQPVEYGQPLFIIE